MRRKIVKKLVENPLYNDARRFVMVVLSACIMAININSFIHAGNLLPGGFSGITLLIQQIGLEFWKIKIPYTLVNLLLNAVPVVISFKYIGKKFTGYSCLMLVLSSILTDILPGFQVTDDILLVCVFGGIIHAFALSLCLNADSTSGGTDFIAIFFSEKYGIILLIAGSLSDGGRPFIPSSSSLPPPRCFTCFISATRSRRFLSSRESPSRFTRGSGTLPTMTLPCLREPAVTKSMSAICSIPWWGAMKFIK